VEEISPHTPDNPIQRNRFVIDSPLPQWEETKSKTKNPSVLDMINDKLKSPALLRCGICGWRDVKWRCLDETCPGFTDFKFYDLCTSGIHGEHEHLIMTPEDRAEAMRYFTAPQEGNVAESDVHRRNPRD
jgi:hypothetical protein